MADRRSALNSGAFRFALIFAGVFALAALLLLGMVRHRVGHYARQATIGALTTETATLVAEADGDLARTIARRIRAAPDGGFHYLLLDRSGRKILGTVPRAAARPGLGSVMMFEELPTPDHPEQRERLTTLGTRMPDGSLLVVASDGYDVERLGERMTAFTSLWALAITLLALLGGWWAGRIFLDRLAGANAAIERIIAGRRDQRLPMIGLAPELDDLARNLNRLLDRIDGLVEGLAQISTDVAHDLRTPLTRLRQTLEAARDAARRQDADAGIDSAIAQADQVLATFRAIVRLAQVEGGGRRAGFAPVDLDALIAGLIETYEPVAADAGHSLAAAEASAATIAGDRELLAQLFANLIENAIIHTPAGTHVVVAIARDADRLTISVSDNGPGVPDAERTRIARRFYQIDPSRSGGGAGLGLAMADAIARLHGASLDIGDARPGLRVSVHFPLGDTALP